MTKPSENRTVELATQQGLLLSAWESVMEKSSAIYLSGPITTGPRFVQWHALEGHLLDSTGEEYRKELGHHVIAPNSADIQKEAGRLRRQYRVPVLEPATLNVSGWRQNDYLSLWNKVIETLVARMIMMPGWQYSFGCATEIASAFRAGIPVTTIDGIHITPRKARNLLQVAAHELKSTSLDPLRSSIADFADSIEAISKNRTQNILGNLQTVRKDQSLDRLADLINVAQFVSFSPDRGKLQQEYSRVIGYSPNKKFASTRHALGTLLERSPDGSINLRSYTPDSPQSREFIYGIRSLEEAVGSAERLGSEGLYVIANETVDVSDGGVSGVALAEVVEFTPDDTPRGVEKPGTASLPFGWANDLLATVYGFVPDIAVPDGFRLEFSVHPKPRGWRASHTLGWELGADPTVELSPRLTWPNNFSRMIGDKTYGLLIANLAGLPVPYTEVISRRIAPFAFGRRTGHLEHWLRTSPREQVPGKYTTIKGWMDPFALLQAEDPENSSIASVLSQAAIGAVYSGAAIVGSDGRLIIEGNEGEGDRFMMGENRPQLLPTDVKNAVLELYASAERVLGPVRFEWVYDGQQVWVVQLHRGVTQSLASTIVPGEAGHWVLFDVSRGLAALRTTIEGLSPNEGLSFIGDVGLTSHIADVVRKAGVPTRISSTA
ncbi:hypothetical protein [Aminobacter sp. DSM 101952]|uniref:hypothetical protein n=1 Tax=Aminobacter sp. DSM 101952 TaxID=2735891 RepID=UPI00184F7379|nr:hypothetical protein [Aminobacter sp. DSM 101952]